MKTCNNPGYCKNKKVGGTSLLCTYVDYCDFQAPRDSRMVNNKPNADSSENVSTKKESING